MKLLVTGAAGFIGSTYVHQVAGEHDVTVLDKLTSVSYTHLTLPTTPYV